MYLGKEEALDHPVRGPLMERIRQEPGISLTELAQAFQVTPSTVLWHARKLAAADLLRSERPGRRRLFFATQGGMQARQVARQRDALSRHRAQDALAAIMACPGLTATAVARRLGIGLRLVRPLLASLVRSGLLQEQQGTTTRYAPQAPRMQGALSRAVTLKKEQDPKPY